MAKAKAKQKARRVSHLQRPVIRVMLIAFSLLVILEVGFVSYQMRHLGGDSDTVTGQEE